MTTPDPRRLARRTTKPPANPTQRPTPAVPLPNRPLTTEQHTRHLALSHALRTPITAARELLTKAGCPDGDLLDLADLYVRYVLTGQHPTATEEVTCQRHPERLTDPTPTAGTPAPISAAYGHATAVKRPSPPPPDRWQLPPEPDVPQLQDATGCQWRRDPAGWTRVDEADDNAWRSWPWWRLLVRRGPLTATPAAHDTQGHDLATLADTGQQTAVRVPTLDEWED